MTAMLGYNSGRLQRPMLHRLLAGLMGTVPSWLPRVYPHVPSSTVLESNVYTTVAEGRSCAGYLKSLSLNPGIDPGFVGYVGCTVAFWPAYFALNRSFD